MVRFRVRLELAVSSSAAEEGDIGKLKFDILSDAMGEGGVSKFIVPAGAVDTPVQLSNVASVKAVAIRTKSLQPNVAAGSISIRRNSLAGEQLPIVALPSSKEGLFVLTGEGTTSLYVSNPGTSPVEVTIALAGD